MAKEDKKLDKMVGGNKLPKFIWHVEVDGIGLSGVASDARSAALDASAARKTLEDALHADAVLASVPEPEDKTKK